VHNHTTWIMSSQRFSVVKILILKFVPAFSESHCARV